MNRALRTAAAALCAAAVFAQEPPAQADAAETRGVSLERLVERANHVNPYLSAQAVKALEARGVEALPALEAFVARRSIYALSAPVTTWLGALDDPRAEALLLRAVDDREFPWRPFAVKAMAVRPNAIERAAFRRLLTDALPLVREAAALGLKAAAAGEEAPPAAETAALRALLADDSFDVRAAAAEALLARGDRAGVPVMLGGLELTRKFFDLDFGETARRRAFDLVAPTLGPGIGYEPGAPPDQRAFWAEIARARYARIAGAEAASRPAGAEWPPDVEGVIFGLEVRSCRRGDSFVRLTGDGDLVIGQYDLKRAKLAPERREALRAAIEDVRSVPSASLYGRPGCDYERYYVPDEEGLVKITVGPDGRPPKARRLSGLILGAIREHFGPDAGALHLERTAPFATIEDQDADPEDG